MSQANVELVREIYEGMNRRDWAALLAAIDENAALVVHESVGPEAGVFHGREGFGRWFSDWFVAFGEDYRQQVEEARSVGDRVFIVVRHHGHGRSSGAEVELENAQIISLREGKIVEAELYGSRAEALKPLGWRSRRSGPTRLTVVGFAKVQS